MLESTHEGNYQQALLKYNYKIKKKGDKHN
jgi:hypothetical protein